MTELSKILKEGMPPADNVEEIDIDFLLHDVLIIKAESLKCDKIFNYADYLEGQLMKIKKGTAVLGVK